MRPPSPTVRRAVALGLAGLLATLSCGREITGPDARHRVANGFSFEAHFGSADLDDGVAGSLVAFTKVRVILNTVGGRSVIDQMVDFPAGADEVPVAFSIPISIGAPDSGETMALSLAYVNATGDTVFRGGPDNVLVVPTSPGAPPPPPVGITVDYTGPGAEAAAVVIAESPDTVLAGLGFAFTATAVDGSAVPIPNTPIAWRTLEPSIAAVTDAGAGAGTSLPSRGVARIVAQLLTGPADTVELTVLPKASAIAVFAGDGQLGIPSQQLVLPIVVRVTATDALPIAGVTVGFAAADGGSVGSPTAITDAAGLAQTTWTLGPVGGPPQSLSATVAGLTGSPLTFAATTPALTLLHHYPMAGDVSDAVGNEDGTLINAAAVADGVLTPGGVDGRVSFESKIIPTIGSFSLSLFIRNRAPLTLNTDYITQGLIGSSRFHFGHSSSGVIRAGENWNSTGEPAPPLDGLFHHFVLVVDAGANSTKLYVDGTLRQTLGSAIALNASGDDTELGAQFEATPASMDGDLDELKIYQGALSAAQITTLYAAGPTTLGRLVFQVQPSDINAGNVIEGAVKVRVEDAMGRAATGYNGSVTIAISENPGAATLNGATTVAAVAGVATFGDLSIEGAASGYTLVATASGFVSEESTPFDVSAAAATQLVWTQMPTDALEDNWIVPEMTLEARDVFNNYASSFNGNVTLAFGANPSGATLGGSTTVAAEGGIAIFQDITVSQPGTGYTLTASSPGLPDVTSTPFNVALVNLTNAWTNVSGGSWSLASNWSLGRVPETADSVVIGLSGTYTVTLDVNFTSSRITVGGGTGVQTLSVPASRTLSVTAVLTVLPTGTLSVSGSGTVNGGGAVVNQGSVFVNSATIPIAVQNNGQLTGQGNAILSGVISNFGGGVLTARGSAAFGAATFTVTNGFTNNGQIELTAIDGGYNSTFGVTNGTLVNGALGTIISLAGVPGGGRTLAAQLNNQGDVATPYGLTISKASAAHQNSGTFNLSGGNLTVTQTGTPPSFTNTGMLNISPGLTLAVNGGTLDLTAGGVTGFSGTLSTSGTTLLFSGPATARTRLTLTSTTVPGTFTVPVGDSLILSGGSPNFTLVNNGTLVLQDNVVLNGTLTTSTTSAIIVRSNAAYGSSNVTVANGFVNNGSIELIAFDGGYSVNFNVPNGTLLNSPTGTITSSTGVAGGGRTLAVTLDNQGVVATPYPLTVSKASAAHNNTGTINITGGNLSVSLTGTTPSFTNNGTINVGAGRTLSVSGGTLDLTAGLLDGPTGLLSTSGTTLLFTNTTNVRTRLTLTSTTVPGTYTVPVGDSLLLAGGSPTFTLVNNGKLVLQDNIVLNGSLATSATSTISIRSNALYGSTNATITNGFTNNGAIDLIAFDGGYSVNLNVTTGSLINSPTGTITSNTGVAGGGRTISAVLNNQGIITTPYALSLNRASAAHTNSGTINITGASFSVTQTGTTPSFTNTGTINVGAGLTFSVSGGTLDLTAGLVDGGTGVLSTSGTTLLFTTTATVRTRLTLSSTTVPGTYTVPVGDSLVLAGGSPTFTLVNNGTLVLQDNIVVNGSLTTATASTIQVRSSALYGSTNATFTNGFTNNGAIDLIAFDGGYSVNLNVTTGTLVNSPTGTITSLTGVAGGGRTIAAQLDNQGTIATPYGLTLSKASALHVNSGTINITTASLTVTQTGTTPSFTNTGTINVSAGRTFSVSGGTLDLTAGLIDGTSGTLATSSVTLLFNTTGTVRTRLTLSTTTVPGTYTVPVGDSLVLSGGSPTFTLVNNGRLVLQNNLTLNGSLTTATTSTIELRSNAEYGSASVVITNGFTNNGSIELIAFDGGYSVNLTVTTGTLVNSATGTITSSAGVPGGGRTIAAVLDNQGILDVPYGLTLAKPSAAHLNSGTINLTGGNLTVNQSGTLPTFTNTGTVNVAAGRVFSVTGGTLDLTAGLVDGPTGLLSTNLLSLLFSSTATVRTQLTLTSTTVPGTYTVPAGDSLLLAGGSPDFTMVNNGRLVLQDNITLNGSLTTASTSEIIVRSNVLYGSTTAIITNGFTNNGLIDLIALDGGYSVTLGVTNGVLANSPSGTILSSVGVPGGARTLAVTLNNQGTVDTPYALTLAKASAAHVNSGTINVTGGNLTVNQSGTTPTFTNGGTITLSPGRVMSVSGGTLDLTAGQLNGQAGTLTTSSATLTFTAPSQARTRLNLLGSTISGTFTVPVADSLILSGGSPNFTLVNNGKLVLQDNITMNGSLSTGTTSAIEVRSNAEYGSSSASFANGFTNNGTLDLIAFDGGYSVTLGVTTGMLVNSPSGTINSLTGVAGGGRTLAAALDNQGLLEIPYALVLVRASAAHTNSGTINLTTGNLSVSQSGTAPSFTNTGMINVTAGRTLSVTGGTLDLSAGLLSGPAATLATSGTTLLFTTATAPIRLNLLTTTVPGTITVPVGDTLRLLNGVLSAVVNNSGVIHAIGTSSLGGGLTTSATSKLLVRGNAETGAVTLTVGNSFTNNGLIELTTIDGGYNTAFTVAGGGTLLNAAGGTISVLPGAGGARTFTAGLLSNFGTFDVNATTTVAAPLAQYLTMTVAATRTLTVSGALTLYSGSTTTVNGTLVKSGGCTNLGGVIGGPGTGATCP